MKRVYYIVSGQSVGILENKVYEAAIKVAEELNKEGYLTWEVGTLTVVDVE